MEILTDILFIYLAIYTLFFLVLALRNLNDRYFKIEKRYSSYSDQENLAVIIYSHNNKHDLANLIENLKSQDYPLQKFRVFAILDNCNDNSEELFYRDSFANAIPFNNGETLGKDKAVSLVLSELKKDAGISSYVFIDGNRTIPADFLFSVNSALVKNSVITGETIMSMDNLDIIEKIKAVYQKYHMNFLRQARSLLRLASDADSGVFIIKKEIVDAIGSVNFKDINSELKYSLLLSKIGCKCTYNPNIQTFVNSVGYVFKRPNLSARLNLFFKCLRQLKTTNYQFIEHVFSLIAPNFWLFVVGYAYILCHSFNNYFFVDFKYVLFSFVLLFIAFGISLVNSKLKANEMLLLCTYPVYSLGHIVKNLPPVRKIQAKRFSTANTNEKFTVDVNVLAGGRSIPCKLEFLREKGVYKTIFIFKNKKYKTKGYLRLIDALKEIKSKLDDYGFGLKICNYCQYYNPSTDYQDNMIKGCCEANGNSPTVLWKSCDNFCCKSSNTFLDEIIKKGETN